MCRMPAWELWVLSHQGGLRHRRLFLSRWCNLHFLHSNWIIYQCKEGWEWGKCGINPLNLQFGGWDWLWTSVLCTWLYDSPLQANKVFKARGVSYWEWHPEVGPQAKNNILWVDLDKLIHPNCQPAIQCEDINTRVLIKWRMFDNIFYHVHCKSGNCGSVPRASMVSPQPTSNPLLATLLPQICGCITVW